MAASCSRSTILGATRADPEAPLAEFPEIRAYRCDDAARRNTAVRYSERDEITDNRYDDVLVAELRIDPNTETGRRVVSAMVAAATSSRCTAAAAPQTRVCARRADRNADRLPWVPPNRGESGRGGRAERRAAMFWTEGRSGART